MLRLRVILFVLFLTYFNVQYFNAQNIKVNAKVDSTNYKIGDFINYTLEIKHPQDVKIKLPSIKDSIKVLDFIKQKKTQFLKSENEITEKYCFVFSKYDSAEVIIPKIKIGYFNKTDSLNLKYITSNDIYVSIMPLEVDAKADIKDVKQPIKIPYNWLLIIFIAIFVLTLVLIAIYFWRKRKLAENKKNEEIKIILPPDVEALQALEELQKKELWQKGKLKEFHSQITYIIRKYLERQYDFPALEITSSEILEFILANNETQVILDQLKDFLTNADLVKFAKFTPDKRVNEEMFNQAFEIINLTKKVQKEIAEEKTVEVTNV